MRAKAETHVTRTTTLVMNEEESRWLQGVMQNPLHGEDPTSEDPMDRRMREHLWQELARENG